MTSDSDPRSALTARRILLVATANGAVARRTVLHELGHSVDTVPCMEDALRCLQECAYDLAVVDDMGQPDDAELVRRLRSECPRLRVVLISGLADARALDTGNTGADVVIQKGAREVDHLVRAVRQLLRRSVTRRPPASASVAANARRSGAG